MNQETKEINLIMEKEFVPYQPSFDMKELGFDDPCFAVYIDKTLIIEDDWLYSTNQDTFIESSNFTAPLYQQAFRWFREKYDLHSLIGIYPNTKEWYSSYQDLNWSGKETLDFNKTEDRSIRFKTYEEAELECLKKLIQIAKNK
jgi:hypothetical protein